MTERDWERRELHEWAVEHIERAVVQYERAADLARMQAAAARDTLRRLREGDATDAEIVEFARAEAAAYEYREAAGRWVESSRHARALLDALDAAEEEADR